MSPTVIHAGGRRSPDREYLGRFCPSPPERKDCEMAVSKRVRFEVLRRDNHQCRYCGAAAPDVALTVDHVIPVVLGGSDDPSNLVAACQDCNGGKTSVAPDAPLVADVQNKAVLWAQAMVVVAEERASARERSDALCAVLQDQWELERPDRFSSSQLPRGWRPTIQRFLDSGLEPDDLRELISVAMETRAARNKWRYFCGCCWTRIRQAHARAQEILTPAAVEDRGTVKVTAGQVAACDVPLIAHVVSEAWTSAFGGFLPMCCCGHLTRSCGDLECLISATVIAARLLFDSEEARRAA